MSVSPLHPTRESTRDPSHAGAPAQTVTAALELIDALSSLDGQSLSQLARSSGNSLNRTFRLLGALEEAGFVARDASKAYHLGPRLVLLGQRSARRNPVMLAAAPSLDWLSHETGETVSLALRVGLRRTVVSTRESRHPLNLRMDAGDRISLHWGALGLCLLAFSPAGVREQVLSGPLERYSPQTLTDPALLEAHLKTVRTQGFDLAREPELGIYSLAAPILDRSDEAVAALAIAGPLSRLTDSLERTYTRLLLEASTAVGLRLEQGF